VFIVFLHAGVLFFHCNARAYLLVKKRNIPDRMCLAPNWRRTPLHSACFFSIRTEALASPRCRRLSTPRKKIEREKGEVRVVCHSRRPPSPSSALLLSLGIMVRHHLLSSFCPQISCFLAVHDGYTTFAVDWNGETVIAA
jgi:hypothetical protein